MTAISVGMTPPIVKNKEAKSKEEKVSDWVIASIKNYYTISRFVCELPFRKLKLFIN